MSWVLVAYNKSDDAFATEVNLPAAVDLPTIKSLVGDYPNLHADSFPVVGASLDRLMNTYVEGLDPTRFEYFIEFR